MNYLASFLTAVCAASVFIGALYILCPEGNMSKTVAYALGLVFILSVTAASGITVKSVDISLPETEYSVDDSEESLVAAAEYVYSYALKSEGIDFSEIEVFTNKSEDGSISISKVRILSSEDRGKIIAALGSTAEALEVEIINE